MTKVFAIAADGPAVGSVFEVEMDERTIILRTDDGDHAYRRFSWVRPERARIAKYKHIDRVDV